MHDSMLYKINEQPISKQEPDIDSDIDTDIGEF